MNPEKEDAAKRGHDDTDDTQSPPSQRPRTTERVVAWADNQEEGLSALYAIIAKETDAKLADMAKKIAASKEETDAATDAKIAASKEETDAATDAKIAASKEEIKEETDAKIAALKAASTKKGVTTNAQFYEHIYQDRSLDMTSNLAEIWDKRSDWPLGKKELKVPPKNCHEQDHKGKDGVQTIISRILKKLKDHGTNTAHWVSLPDPDAFKRPSFASRKPDIVNYEKTRTGSLGITSFGDLKRRGEGDFTNDEKGHILDMARKFMECVGLNRPFVIVFLSDGLRWQFFRVERSPGSDLKYREGPAIDGARDGWERYVALLTADVHEVGHFVPQVEGYDLVAPLGRGGSSTVYKGVPGGGRADAAVVKVFLEQARSSLEAERNALRAMKGIPGVPILIAEKALCTHVEGTLGSALVLTPVGKPILPCQNGEPINGKHLKELVGIVQKAHGRKWVHRDIKPDNVFLSAEDMLLNDWSSAVDASDPNTTDSQWEGTYGFSVSPDEKKFKLLSPMARDLVSVVRCAYSLLFLDMPPTGNEPGIASKVETYWDEHIREGTLWMDALEFAEQENYDELGKLLGRMK